MKRLFLLSMAFIVVVLLFMLGVLVMSRNFNDWRIIFGLLLVVISGPGIITLGVMLVKHIRDIFKC